MNLITPVIGFAMSATFIVFVCARLICGRFRGFQSRQMFEIDTRIDLERQEQRITGLEPVMVAAIPTMKFNREAFSSVEDAQCTICLAEYQEKEVLRLMPKCGHSFHLSCIDVWLRKQSTCPVCRLSVQDAFQTKHIATRPAMAARPDPDNSLETSGEISTSDSRQWLLPDHGQGSGQRQVESTVGVADSAR